MDNKLISGAILLLILQAFLLIADVDLYPQSTENFTSSTQHSPIGVIINKRQDVKRRSQGSIVWEESSSADTLLSFDSLLTLDNSSAKIQLENDIEIDLHENTLIVIEPNEKQENGSLKVRFNRGNLLSKNKNKALQLGTSDWQISVTPGTGLSLKSVDNENVEVEVTKGEVKVVNKNNPEVQSVISSGVRQSLAKNSLGTAYNISENLKFNLREDVKIYTHGNAEDFLLNWQGEAESLRVISSDKTEKIHVVAKNQQELVLNFKFGTHNLSLINSEQMVSREIRLRVLPAPRIRYTSPLPRDRFQIHQPIFFSWTPLDEVKSYELELTNNASERERLPTALNTLVFAYLA
jgi:FecR protein